MTPLKKVFTIISIGIILFLFAFWLATFSSEKIGSNIKLGGVLFDTSIDSAINESMNQNKPVFLYFRSETCYWCIVFEKEALSNDRIIEILNKEFILVSIDTIKQQKIALNLNVRSTPYMIFFDKNGQEISRIPGYIPEDEFLEKVLEILEQLNER